jgi:hypothetical protein
MVLAQRLILVRTATALLLGLSAVSAAAQPDERVLDAERCALDAERRAVAAERQALESERRAFEAERNASAGSGRPILDPQACQVANNRYQLICLDPSREAIRDTPECAAAHAEMRLRCGA